MNDQEMTLTVPSLVAGALVRGQVRHACSAAMVLGAHVHFHEERGLLESVFAIRATGTGPELAPLLSLLKARQTEEAADA